MKLTCVTAVFNAIKSGNRENLIRCVKSVAALKTEHEHLIYDGASTDGTVELLRELEKKTLGLKVASEPDTGIYNALNKGVRDAKGEWFYVLGADDYLCDPAWMDELLQNESPITDNIIAPVDRGGAGWLFRRLSDLRTTLYGFPYSHQGMIMKTELVRSLGGFDERFVSCADWDMQYKCHSMGSTYHYVLKPFAYYAEGGFSENPAYADIIIRDHDIIHSRAMGFTLDEYVHFKKSRWMSLRKLLPLLQSNDLAYRISARYILWRMLAHRLKMMVRFVLYPLVVATRSMRYKCKED